MSEEWLERKSGQASNGTVEEQEEVAGEEELMEVECDDNGEV